MNESLPYSAPSERNKGPILEVLRDVFAGRMRVLEIGAGTGQHAVHFAGAMPELEWWPTEMPGNLAMLRPRCAAAGLANLQSPQLLDVTDKVWPITRADAVYAANVSHIMGWPAVVALFEGVGRVLAAKGVFCLYGPFNYGGEFTSESNAAFDAQLRGRDANMGIRDLRDLKALGTDNGLSLEADHSMPANNRLLVWRRKDGP